jgi:hypothetical protein
VEHSGDGIPPAALMFLALIMVGAGLALVTGEWQRLSIPLQRRFARWGWPPI